jgi:hypothetical protein
MRRILLYLFIFISIAVEAQEITVKTWLDTSTIYIGDQIFYNIEINQPDSFKLSAVFPADTLVNGVMIVSQSQPDTIDDSNLGFTILSKQLITSFDSGKYEIPPFFVEYFDGNSRVRYYSDYTYLNVLRTNISPADSTEIFDIVGPYSEKITPAEILPWSILIIFLIVAGWLLYRRLSMRRGEVDPNQAGNIPQEPIHIIILRDLDKLDRLELWQKGNIKEFYSRLTDILRHFLELKYNIPALEMTTSEIMQTITGRRLLSDTNKDDLNEILSIADLSKFAKYAPGAEINSRMISRSKDLVNRCCKITPEHKAKVVISNPEEVSNE